MIRSFQVLYQLLLSLAILYFTRKAFIFYWICKISAFKFIYGFLCDQVNDFSKCFVDPEKSYIFYLRHVRSYMYQTKLTDYIIQTCVCFGYFFLFLSFAPIPLEIY